MNVTYLKEISMNSYFFFGFRIFKDFTVTFMCQIDSKTILDRITELDLNFLP